MATPFKISSNKAGVVDRRGLRTMARRRYLGSIVIISKKSTQKDALPASVQSTSVRIGNFLVKS
jgi:hypothetical protein